MAFQRLIRFLASDGKTYFGNLLKETPTLEIEGSKVEVLDGSIEAGFKKTGSEATVSKVRINSRNKMHRSRVDRLIMNSYYAHYLLYQ